MRQREVGALRAHVQRPTQEQAPKSAVTAARNFPRSLLSVRSITNPLSPRVMNFSQRQGSWLDHRRAAVNSEPEVSGIMSANAVKSMSAGHSPLRSWKPSYVPARFPRIALHCWKAASPRKDFNSTGIIIGSPFKPSIVLIAASCILAAGFGVIVARFFFPGPHPGMNPARSLR